MNSHLLRFDKTKKLLIFDFETYNLNLSFIVNRPWQIATMMIQGNDAVSMMVKGKPTLVYDRFIRWKNCDLKISAGAAEKTGFDPIKYEKEAIDSDIVFDDLHAQFEEADYLIAHNGLGFDIYLLKEWYIMKGKPFYHLTNKLIDTNCIARGIKLGIPFKQGDNLLEYQYKVQARRVKSVKSSLSTLGKEFNIDHDYEHLHRAEVDIDLNRKVWNVLKYQIEL